MPIRPATWADLSAISSLCAGSFQDDELFGEMMHPLRKEYPVDFEQYFVRRNRVNWWDYTHVWYVATTTDIVDGKEQEVVAGIAEWELQGTVSTKLAWWDPRNSLKPTMSLLNRLSLFCFPNRAANPDPLKRDPFYASFPFFHHHWQGERANSVYLDLLAVHPKYQGRGLAKELVQWGLDKADAAGVCASVIASESGYGLYKRMGFTTEVGRCTEGEGNPLGELKSGAILFKDYKKGSDKSNNTNEEDKN
ncbi:acyl-CoA N-acyltransferase [Lepidopterella palustris CBS 459.81]|uniref:Acyl-CoA N-acyltransferase n=1 Tax=Lepidopterella palustris CBS 459.81 TaxID=1314670 RepID=A0A8E2EBC4_9PEZI|nr:acyl-CoA N-acyltransferase [Lepidopterella palustris CBS 459.81]